MILALDTATTSGACWGNVGETPQYESWVAKGDSLGEKKSRFRFWLMAKVMAFQPDLICFEAPYIPVQRAPQPPARFRLRVVLRALRASYAVAWYPDRALCFPRSAPCARVLRGGTLDA